MVEKRRGRDREIPILLNTLHYDNSMTHLSNLHNIDIENVSLNERQENTILCIHFENFFVIFYTVITHICMQDL
jgi:hypothetical protein